MAQDELLGRVVTLPVRRFGSPGAFLARDKNLAPNAPTILLPGAEVPEGTKEGDELSVFVYLDSEDRPVATTRAPKIELSEVAFLQVTAQTRFGAFVDWGMPKELLVPRAEQTREIRVGERHPIGVFIDESGRLAGTMRVSEMLSETGDFEPDEWLEGEAWRNEPGLGLFVILEQRFFGMVPAFEPHGMSRGQAGTFRVSNILPDGKLELSLRGHAHTELESDAAIILAKILQPGTPRVGDRSSPEEIRELFGLSKKAFKRAVGRLLKQQSARLDEQGFLVASAPSPR